MARPEDEYEGDEDEDDDYEDESEPPPRRGRAPRATLGDPMAQGNFVKRRTERHELRAPARPAPQRPGPQKPKGASLDALGRIREQRAQESFRKGFAWGAGVIGMLAALASAVVVLTDGGYARRSEMAQIELDRVKELAEDGDAEAAELRVAEIMALIAGPAATDDQMELVRQHSAHGRISDAEIEWIERAAAMAGEGMINDKILAATRTDKVGRAAGDSGPDVFTKDMKTTMSKKDIREMGGEDLDGRDLGLGKPARAQRQNRKTMGKANKGGRSMLRASGKDPDSVDVPEVPD